MFTPAARASSPICIRTILYIAPSYNVKIARWSEDTGSADRSESVAAVLLAAFNLTTKLYIYRVVDMAEDLRMSPQTVLVVNALLLARSEWRYGYDLSRETGLKSGTLYPILVRLTERKWLEARWEHPDGEGKPRHMYRLTPGGRSAARAFVERARAATKGLKPNYARS
jgi:predicted transcriptional regulator